MSDQDKSEIQEESNITSELSTVGELLRTAREEAGLTIADVAGHLKLSLPQLQALEDNAFDRLPGPVFVRGFARSYARYLHLDEAQLLSALDRQLPRPIPTEQNIETETLSSYEIKPVPWHLIGGVLIVLVVAVVAGWWLWGGSGDGHAGTSLPEQDPNTLAPMMTEQASSVAGESSMPSALVTSESVTLVSPTISGETVAGQKTIWMKANAPVWLSVHDASGTQLISSTLTTGEERKVTGKSPLKIRISNIDRLEMRDNDQPVDLNVYKRGQRLRIRFELN